MFVEQVMTRAVVTVRPDTSVEHAWSLLREGRFRHLPVTDGDRVVGMISDRDLRVARARVEEHGGAPPTVGSVARPEVVTVNSGTPAEEASRLMLEHKIGALPVVDGGRLVGIVTESDLFQLLIHVMGVMVPSTRLQLDLDAPTRQLAETTRLANELNLQIVSLVTEPSPTGAGRSVVIRVDSIAPDRFVRALADAGIRVIGPPSVR